MSLPQYIHIFSVDTYVFWAKGLKKWAAVLTAAAVLGAGGAVYAVTSLTPAEIAANVTGKSVAELQQQRQAGQTYGAIANEAGKLKEFKDQMLEQKKVTLNERVTEGRLTQEQANTIYQNMQEKQANCDGTGNGCQARMGQNCGAEFGKGAGCGNGAGLGNGQCKGMGMARD